MTFTDRTIMLRPVVLRAIVYSIAAPAAQAQVTFERLRHAAKEPGNWLTYSGEYGSWRYSPLDQITPQNVATLRVAWVHQAEDPGRPGLMETTPLVDGNGRFPGRASPATTPGRLRAGSTARARPGSPAPTSRSSTSCTAAATRDRTGTATCGPATTSTAARCSRSSPRLGSCAGTSSTRHTTSTTGTPIRSRCCSTRRSAAGTAACSATANRNAFYYLLDRETGEFLHAKEFAKQTWADGIDASGRPMVRPNTEPSEEGTLVWPSLQGATNWFSPSYNPKTKLFYVPVREMGAYYFKGEAEYEAGSYYTGGGERALRGDQTSGAIRALDVSTGEMKWNWKLLSPPWSGVMATAGGVVFGGTQEGHIFALDASTGEPLWSFSTGSPVRTNPMSFTIEGRQHVAMAGGNALFVFGLP